MSQESSNSTNMTNSLVPTSTNASIPNINHQSSTSQSYCSNQGTNQGTNEAPYVSYPQTNGDVEESAPPPSYDEVMANSSSKL